MSLGSSIDQSFLPNLPGFRAKQPPRTGKARHLDIVNGSTFVRDDPLPSLENYDIPEDASVCSIGNTTALRTRRKPTAQNADTTLTFQAYFEEDPVRSNPHSRQIRKCNIYFYTEDGTMKIVEKPQLNSGVSQGTLVRRAAIPKPDGSSVTEQDLVLGNKIKVYGRTYT